jgi:integrase
MGGIKSPATKKVYAYAFKDFMLFAKAKKPEDILRKKPMVLQNVIIDYNLDMKDKRKFSYATRSLRLNAVMKFCEMNDITINWKKCYSFLGEFTRLAKDRAYTKDEIRKILDKYDERKRVIILLLVSTGMRIGALPDLRLKHLKKIPINDEGQSSIYQLIVYENTKSEYTTFTTTECAKAIDSYLAYRKQSGEDLTPDAPLIREQFDKDSASEPRPRTRANFVFLIYQVLQAAGIRTPKSTPDKPKGNRKEVMANHGFRKYWNTSIIAAGAKQVVKEMLIGHNTGLERSYYKPTDAELLTEYLKAIDYLTISEEKKLQREVAKLKTEIADVDMMKRSYIAMKSEAEDKSDRIKSLEDAVAMLVEAQKEREELEKHKHMLQEKD